MVIRASVTEPRTGGAAVSIDVTEIGRKETQEWLRRFLEDAGQEWQEFSGFWERFSDPAAGPIPARTLVVGNLASIARHYRSHRSQEWLTSVRRARPMFLALVRTRRDESLAGIVDDLLRDSDHRMIVCREGSADHEVRESMAAALTALEPDSILEVRYSAPRDLLWIAFSDGLSGFIGWGELGIEDLEKELVCESARVGEHGKTLELATRKGDLFEIDSASIRAVLDIAFRRALLYRATTSDEAVGERLRSVREGAGLSQTELGRRTGIDQAVLSRLERGKHRPRVDTLRRIANALGLSVPDLLAGAPPA